VLKRVNATTLEAQYMKGGKATIKQTGSSRRTARRWPSRPAGPTRRDEPVNNVAV